MQTYALAVLVDQGEVGNLVAGLRLKLLIFGDTRWINAFPSYDHIFEPRSQTRNYQRRLHAIAFGKVVEQTFVFQLEGHGHRFHVTWDCFVSESDGLAAFVDADDCAFQLVS